ncbi:MAG: hypothetical protein KA371_07645 [Acidobacteria bacterium]|nr:hypothetical protein [Acidobacteriota bacterium]
MAPRGRSWRPSLMLAAVLPVLFGWAVATRRFADATSAGELYEVKDSGHEGAWRRHSCTDAS